MRNTKLVNIHINETLGKKAEEMEKVFEEVTAPNGNISRDPSESRAVGAQSTSRLIAVKRLKDKKMEEKSLKATRMMRPIMFRDKTVSTDLLIKTGRQAVGGVIPNSEREK